MSTGQGQGADSGSQTSLTPVDMSTQVQVTVDGQQQTMSIQDLANGYAAGAKMTQATQRAADLERELVEHRTFWQNIQDKPHEMIPALADKFKVTIEAPASGGDNLYDDDPLSQEVSQLKQALAQNAQEMKVLQGQIQHQAQTRQIDRTVTDLTDAYGDNFKLDEVQAYATANNVPDLRLAYHAMQGEKMSQSAPPPPIGQTVQTLGSMLPGTAVAAAPPVEGLPPATTLAESMIRASARMGQEIQLSDIVPS